VRRLRPREAGDEEAQHGGQSAHRQPVWRVTQQGERDVSGLVELQPLGDARRLVVGKAVQELGRILRHAQDSAVLRA
jgi:hypothetical protein